MVAAASPNLNGGRAPRTLPSMQPLTFAKLPRTSPRENGLRRPEDYQAWLVPQWGQPTEVVTSALKLYPHWHRYRA